MFVNNRFKQLHSRRFKRDIFQLLSIEEVEVDGCGFYIQCKHASLCIIS